VSLVVYCRLGSGRARVELVGRKASPDSSPFVAQESSKRLPREIHFCRGLASFLAESGIAPQDSPRLFGGSGHGRLRSSSAGYQGLIIRQDVGQHRCQH